MTADDSPSAIPVSTDMDTKTSLPNAPNNNTTIFWQPCIEFQRPLSKSVQSTDVSPFVYPHPKHSSPTIVGVAIKRTLKSPETPSLRTPTLDPCLNHKLNGDTITEIEHSAKHYHQCNNNNNNSLHNIHYNTPNGIDSVTMPAVNSSATTYATEHPYKNLFLRKLREKDAAFISERMHRDFFDETIRLISNDGGCDGDGGGGHAAKKAPTTNGVDTFRSAKPDPTQTSSTKTKTTSPTTSSNLHKHHTSSNTSDQTCVAPSESKIPNTTISDHPDTRVRRVFSSTASASSPSIVNMNNTATYHGEDDGDIGDNGMANNNNKKVRPHLHAHSTADTVEVAYATTNGTNALVAVDGGKPTKCSQCGRECERTLSIRLNHLHHQWDDIPQRPLTTARVDGDVSVQCVEPSGSPFIVDAVATTISSTPNTCSVITDSPSANSVSSNPTPTLDNNIIAAILCETCALLVRRPSTQIATATISSTQTTPKTATNHPWPSGTTTQPSIRLEVHDVTNKVSQANEPSSCSVDDHQLHDQTHQQPSISCCTNVATSLLPSVVSSSSTWSSTPQQQSRIISASTEDSTKWAENLLAKLRQEHQVQRFSATTQASNITIERLHTSWPGPVDVEHNLNNNNNNSTIQSNNNSALIYFTPTTTPADSRPSKREQENGCQSDGRPTDDAAPAKILCHQYTLPNFDAINDRQTIQKCCEHNNHNRAHSKTFHHNNNNGSASTSVNFSSAIKQIEAIYEQTDISDIDEEDHRQLLVQISPEKHFSDLCTSPNSDSFEASNRLRRLESRFRDLAFTKKLLVSPTIAITTTTTTTAPFAVAAASLVSSATPTTTHTTICTASSTPGSQRAEGGETNSATSLCWNCCETTSATGSDAIRVRSAIDWPTTSSYCRCCSSAVDSTAIELDPTRSPTTPNSLTVVDASTSHLLECKHNHHQSRESHRSEHDDENVDDDDGLSTHQGQEHRHRRVVVKEEEENPAAGVRGDVRECEWSRVSTSTADTAAPAHPNPSSTTAENPFAIVQLVGDEPDEFVEPDLIRFDDAPISSATASLITNQSATSSSLSAFIPFADESESDEISHIFPDNNTVNQPSSQVTTTSFITSTPPPPLPPPHSLTTLLNRDLHTHCEFDVRHLADYSPQIGRVFECYDELIDSSSDSDDTTSSQAADEDDTDSEGHIDSNQSCDCSLEAIPLQLLAESFVDPFYDPLITNNNYSTKTSIPFTKPAATMRDAGPLRGLLKKPNRPPPTHKNRVVFDETQNKFFDADYIILIREDCQYDEEDDEPCTCGDEHKFVRLCCEEGCQCMEYGGAGGAPVEATADNQRTPQSPKFAPPIEFVDPAALSPPEGYKDGSGGKLSNALGGALGGHVFGAQHMQQLQVIQRLQAQRAAMLAAQRATNGQPPAAGSGGATAVGQPQPTVGGGGGSAPVTTGQTGGGMQQGNNSSLQQQQQQQMMMDAGANVCTECAECAECAAKQNQANAHADCTSPCSDDEPKLENVPLVALAPLSMPISSPERRIIAQKEIIAGEERPKYLFINNQQPAPPQQEVPPVPKHVAHKPPIGVAPLVSQRYVVETITMTTVTERRIVREATDTISTTTSTTNTKSVPAAPSNTIDSNKLMPDEATTGAAAAAPVHPGIDRSAYLNNSSVNDAAANAKPTSAGLSTAAQISGILKGGKLWKSEPSQSDDSTNITSDDESSKRSVRFTDNTKEPGSEHDSNELHATDRELCDGESQKELDEDDDTVSEPIEPSLPPKKHSSIFHNALRPNSAVRQLFPSAAQPPLPAAALTHEALRAFEEAKRSHIAAPVVHSDSETDTIRRTIERNALRRSLIKKKQQRTDNSLEERIRRLTCDVDDNLNNSESSDSNQDGFCMDTLERRDSPAGEENPQQPKYGMDKSFSPSSSASSSSSGSTSAYRKITDIFNRDRRQDRIPEADENPIVIIPQMQECRCPAAPDLGMGVQMPAAHTQIHQTPPRQTDARRQFLSTLAPLTSCVAGQRDDLSYYTLAPGERASTASSQYSEYSLGDIEAVLKTNSDETKKVAPDVIAGTPGQEYDELANFAQQESVRTERLKKRYSAEASASAPNSNAGSDDDEQNDYGFNKRPSVRGIKPRFSSTNEILQQMQAQLSTPTHPQSQVPVQATQVVQVQSNTLPKNHSYMIQKSTAVQPQQPQQAQTLQHHHQHMHQQNQQQQIAQSASVVNHTAIVNQTHQQQIAAWNYYHEQQQRNAAAGYYQTLPLQARHSFHGHEEATVYQNCQTVAMEQHYNRAYARSPTRRPESPPPLRNYHQTMVLIPYNTESYAHFSSNEQQVPGGQQFQRHNVLEYQQVTQQTIRVPMGYPLPGMQLHVVAGRNATTTTTASGGAGGQQFAQYAQHQNAARSFAYAVTDNKQTGGGGKFTERGVPEGAASVPQSDTMMSPTSGGAQAVATSTAAPGAVFYAMNV